MRSELLEGDCADRSVNRRRFIATVGITAVSAVAGCVGGESNGSETTSSDDSGSDGEPNCPSPSSISYTEMELSDIDGISETPRIDRPTSSETEQTLGLGVVVPLGDETVTLSVGANQIDQSMSDSMELGTDEEESTDQYDFADDGARSVTTTGDADVPINVDVYVPLDEGVVAFGVQPQQVPAPCPDAVNAIITRMVESFQLV